MVRAKALHLMKRWLIRFYGEFHKTLKVVKRCYNWQIRQNVTHTNTSLVKMRGEDVFIRELEKPG